MRRLESRKIEIRLGKGFVSFMAISKRNKRKITIGKDVFYWVYKYQDVGLRLIVMTDDKTLSRLICDFNFKELNNYFRELVKDDDFYKDKFLILSPGILTPFVVRQTIDIALNQGWKPFQKDKDFILKKIAHKIDINFWTESTAEERKVKN